MHKVGQLNHQLLFSIVTKKRKKVKPLGLIQQLKVHTHGSVVQQTSCIHLRCLFSVCNRDWKVQGALKCVS